LYQPHRYAERWSPSDMARRVLRSPLEAWDRRAAHSAARYLANSTAVAAQIAALYGVDAEVVPPPLCLSADGEQQAVPGIEPGYVLCIARLLPYKNVDAVVAAF